MTLAGWNQYKSVSISLNWNGEDLTNFPLLLSLTNDTGPNEFDCTSIIEYLTPKNQFWIGTPWKSQYTFNTTQINVLSSASAGTNLPAIQQKSELLVTSSRVYRIGGYTNTSVYYAPINSDGSLGTWVATTSLPVAMSSSQLITIASRVYLLGSYGNPAIYTTTINSDGSIGTWTTTSSLPVTLYDSAAVVTNGRVYLLGGVIGTTPTNAVYTAPINSDGSLGTWTSGTNLPAAVKLAAVAVTKSRVYLIGGHDGSFAKNTVRTAVINSDGTLGTWSSATNLPTTLTGASIVVTASRIYALCGVSGLDSGSNSTSLSAPLDVNGVIGTWATGTVFVDVLYGETFVTNSRCYLLSSAALAVQYIPFEGGANEYNFYRSFKLAVEYGDTNTECYCEIERWDSVNSSVQLWVRIPSILGGEETILRLYYDITHADNLAHVGITGDSTAVNVWDSSYAAVYLLSQNPYFGVKDSTSGGHNLISYGSMTYANLTDGLKQDKVIQFDGTNNYLKSANFNLSALQTAFTIEAFSKLSLSESDSTLVFIGSVSAGAPQLSAYAGSSMLNVGTYGSTFQSNVWVYPDYYKRYGQKMSSGVLTAFTNDNSNPTTNAVSIQNLSSAPIVVSALGDASNTYNNTIRSIRISSVERSQSWLEASFLSDEDNFAEFNLISIGSSSTTDLYEPPGEVSSFNRISEILNCQLTEFKPIVFSEILVYSVIFGKLQHDVDVCNSFVMHKILTDLAIKEPVNQVNALISSFWDIQVNFKEPLSKILCFFGTTYSIVEPKGKLDSLFICPIVIKVDLKTSRDRCGSVVKTSKIICCDLNNCPEKLSCVTGIKQNIIAQYYEPRSLLSSAISMSVIINGSVNESKSQLFCSVCFNTDVILRYIRRGYVL